MRANVCSLTVSTTAASSFCLSVCSLQTSLSGAERHSKHVRSFRAAGAARFQHLTTLLSGKNRNNCPIYVFLGQMCCFWGFTETRTDSCHGDVPLQTPAGTSSQNLLRCSLDLCWNNKTEQFLLCVYCFNQRLFLHSWKKEILYSLTGFRISDLWRDFNMMENNKSSNDRVTTENTRETTAQR